MKRDFKYTVCVAQKGNLVASCSETVTFKRSDDQYTGRLKTFSGDIW